MQPTDSLHTAATHPAEGQRNSTHRGPIPESASMAVGKVLADGMYRQLFGEEPPTAEVQRAAVQAHLSGVLSPVTTHAVTPMPAPAPVPSTGPETADDPFDVEAWIDRVLESPPTGRDARRGNDHPTYPERQPDRGVP